MNGALFTALIARDICNKMIHKQLYVQYLYMNDVMDDTQDTQGGVPCTQRTHRLFGYRHRGEAR